ncbi:MAG: hypothetical protein E7253_08805 [Lachnospiraceae bacterium]|nr:hypothetical protein [Lachnospiraceae bacterium]
MKIEKVEKLFLRMFTSFVRQTGLDWKEGQMNTEDWESLLALSAYHQIIPIIYEAAAQMDEFRRQPPAVAGMWKKESMMAVARQVRMTKEFLFLYKGMEKMGLRPFVMKGIICRNLYPKPDYRLSSDEDIFISRKDFWKMDEYLVKRGFKRTENDEELKGKLHSVHEVGYRNVQTGFYLEVHLSLFAEESDAYGGFNRLFTDLHKKAVSENVEGNDVWTLDYTDHFLYLLCHSAKHFLHSGFGVRQLFDMILFAENYGDRIDWNDIVKKTKRAHIYVFMIHLFDIGVRYLGFDPHKACWPFHLQELDGTLDSEDLLNDILAGGVFGTSTRERQHSANITLAAANGGKKARGLRASLFPNLSYMKKRYSYMKRHPWMLPIGWAHRLLEFVFKKEADGRKTVEIGNRRVALLKKYKMI